MYRLNLLRPRRSFVSLHSMMSSLWRRWNHPPLLSESKFGRQRRPVEHHSFAPLTMKICKDRYTHWGQRGVKGDHDFQNAFTKMPSRKRKESHTQFVWSPEGFPNRPLHQTRHQRTERAWKTICCLLVVRDRNEVGRIYLITIFWCSKYPS